MRIQSWAVAEVRELAIGGGLLLVVAGVVSGKVTWAHPTEADTESPSVELLVAVAHAL